MEDAFYYIVKVNLIRFMQGEEVNYISDEKEFKDANPIIAREKAFDFYNSYIDTLLEPELSHKEIQALIAPRIVDADKGDKMILNPNKPEEVYIPPSIFNGIGVFMKVKNPINRDEVDSEHFLHGVGFLSDYIEFIDSLSFEMEYYKHFAYDLEGKEISVSFYDSDEDEMFNEIILDTPYDWEDLESSQEIDEEIEKNEVNNLSNNQIAELLIKTGEGRMIEFKPSLQAYNNEGDVRFGKFNRFAILKTIAAFLNSNGGFLFVGVGDDGNTIGLNNDFQLGADTSKDSKDYFKIQVDYLIKNNFKSVASNISGNFINRDGEYIYMLKIRPSSKPIFIVNDTDNDESKHRKEFYVRLTGASSIHYYDIEDVVGYCMNHWK